ncbi:MAG: GFA family protein [Rhizobiaceae bacterium]
MTDQHTGSCLCGAVRFRTAGALRGVIYCHCTQCRKQSGHHYASTNVADECLTVEGGENVAWYASSADAKRGFCRACGSALFWKHRAKATTSINAGSFDSPSGLAGAMHIFVADKGDYYDIDDGLPQHARSAAGVTVAGS